MKALLSLAALSLLASPALAHERLFTVPIGDAGLHYESQGVAEALTWGPAALRIGPDGSFWIADGAKDRILCYDARGSLVRVLDLTGIVVGIGDIAITPYEVVVLDIAAQDPKVVRLTWQGREVARHEIPAEIGT